MHVQTIEMGGRATTSFERFFNETEGVEYRYFWKHLQKKHNQLLEGIQRALVGRSTKALLKIEGKLKDERRLIFLQEEMLWLEKSCND